MEVGTANENGRKKTCFKRKADGTRDMKLEFQMHEQSYLRSGSSSRTPSSRYSDSVLDSSKLSSSLSPDADYDSEVSLDLKMRQEMADTSSKKAYLFRTMRLREIEITKYHRDKCKAEIEKEKFNIEANYRRGELEFREKRRLNNLKWHSKEHIRDRDRNKALGRSEEWTREDYYRMKGFDPDEKSDEYVKRDMYLEYDRTKRYLQGRQPTSLFDQLTATCWIMISQPRIK